MSSSTFSNSQTYIQPYLELSRPYNAVAALLTFAVGFVFYAPHHSWLIMALGLLVILLLHSSFTVQNDVYDYEIDLANKRKSALTKKRVTKAALQRFVWYSVLAALAASAYNQQKLYFLGFILLFVFLAWCYNCPPLFLSRRPVWSILLLALYYASTPFLFGFTLGGNGSGLAVILFCVALSVQRFSVSILKDYKDVAGDKKHGKQTFLLAYGHRAVALLSILGCALGYLGVFGVLLLHFRPHRVGAYLALSALLVVVAINIHRRLKLWNNHDNADLTELFSQSFRGENQCNAVLVVCLALL